MFKGYRLIIVLVFMLVLILGCSGKSSNPIFPSDDTMSDLPIAQINESNTNRHLWGVWKSEFDVDSLSASISPVRKSEMHFNVKPYLPPPIIDVLSYDPVSEIVEVDITINNNTIYDAYDLRLIILTDNDGHTLDNADDWTALWDINGGYPANPFKAYAKAEPQRIFIQREHTENLKIKCPNNKFSVQFAIDASYPGNCEEPYSIENFTQNRNLAPSDLFSSRISVDVLDWQDDVNSVILMAAEVTGESVTILESSGAENTWEGLITNATNAPAGDYTGIIIAKSANSGTLQLIDLCTITVSDEYIIGPAELKEYTEGEFSIAVEPDTGMTYEWSVIPETAGAFTAPTLESTRFSPFGVDIDSMVEIQVIVDSDNQDPELFTAGLIVLDAIMTAENLLELDRFNIELTEINNATQYVFNYSEVPPTISIGNVISGTYWSDDPIDPKIVGYLRKVENIEDNGVSLTIDTSDAGIDEAIIDGEITLTLDFSGRGGSSTRYASGGEGIHIIKPENSIAIDLATLDLGWGQGILYNHPKANIEMLNGSYLNFNPVIVIEYKAVLFGEKYFKVTANADFQLLMDLRSTFTNLDLLSLNYEIPVPLYGGQTPFGNVICDYGLLLKLGVDFSVTVGGTVRSGYYYNRENFLVGAQYGGILWPDVTFDYEPGSIDSYYLPTTIENLNGNATIEAYVRPFLGLEFSNSKGKTPLEASLDFKGFCSIEGDFEYNPPDDWCLSWNVYRGYESKLTLTARWWLLDYSENWYLIPTVKIPFCDPYCGSYGPCGDICELEVSQISGSSQVDETDCEPYSVSASGESGITYSWSAIPSNLGYFTAPNSNSTNYCAYEVDQDKNVTLKVAVNCDDSNCDTQYREKFVTIKDIPQGCNLYVSSISGLSDINDDSCYEYSVSASGETGITYSWSADPSNLGYFTTPTSSSTDYCPYDVDNDVNVTIKVDVDCDNPDCNIVYKQKAVTIHDNSGECGEELLDDNGIMPGTPIYDAIYNKWLAMGGGEGTMGCCIGPIDADTSYYPSPPRSDPFHYAPFINGWIVTYTFRTGSRETYAVYGDFFTAWASRCPNSAKDDGAIGLPIGKQLYYYYNSDQQGYYQQFKDGYITKWHESSYAYTIEGSIYLWWQDQGGLSNYGFATSCEQPYTCPTPPYDYCRKQYFNNGNICHHRGVWPDTFDCS